MCGHSSRENRDTSERNLRGTEATTSGATGKVSSHTPVVVSPEESDGNKVPEKSVNNGVVVPGERGRPLVGSCQAKNSPLRGKNKISFTLSILLITGILD